MSGSYFLGPRIGKFVRNEEIGKLEPRDIPGHNAVLAALGTLLLWFGFLPFNAGAGYAVAGEQAAINTGTLCRMIKFDFGMSIYYYYYYYCALYLLHARENAPTFVLLRTHCFVCLTGRAVVVTVLAGASGAVTLLFFGLWRFKQWDLSYAMNGLLGGEFKTSLSESIFSETKDSN